MNTNTTYQTDNATIHTTDSASICKINVQELMDAEPAVKALVEHITDTNTLTTRKMMHEIGNAVTLINSSLQIIEASHPEVRDFKYWSSTMNDLKYLISLLAEISQFNTGNILSLSETNIVELIKSLTSSFTTLNEDISISLTADDLIPDILCDKTKLKQVLINIIKNASEALENITDAKIDISVNFNHKDICIAIADNGCGINAEQLDTIFTPMVTYKKYGSGLGLPISKKIIEAHGGSISVKSAPHQGTVFTIQLPVTGPKTETKHPVISDF